MARTRIPSGNEDTDFVKCRRCGFPCKLSRDKIKPGNGKVFTTLTGVVSQTQYPDNWTVTYGCPQCGRGDYTASL